MSDNGHHWNINALRIEERLGVSVAPSDDYGALLTLTMLGDKFGGTAQLQFDSELTWALIETLGDAYSRLQALEEQALSEHPSGGQQ